MFAFGIIRASYSQERSTITFEGTAPQALTSRVEYYADLLEVAAFPEHILAMRGEMFLKHAARLSGVSAQTLSFAERKITEPHFSTAEKIYTGLGGKALLLAFLPLNAKAQTNSEILAVAANDQQVIKPWFQTACKSKGLTREDVGRLAGVTADTVESFEAAHRSLPSTVAHYFRTALGQRVQFCGIRATNDERLL